MLHLAVLNLNLDAVKLFLKAGASVTIKNNEGQTAFDIAKNLSQHSSTAKDSYAFFSHDKKADKIFQALTKYLDKEIAASESYSPTPFDNAKNQPSS
jgi:ankyrin repeat protein